MMAGAPRSSASSLATWYRRLRGALLRHRRPEAQIERGYARWLERRKAAATAAPGPLISVIMPAYRTPPDVLLAAIASVRAQTYPAWELCVSHDASASMQALGAQAALDRRIKTMRQLVDGGIAAATNDALALATGEFVAFLDHDDELAPHALARIAAEIADYPDTDMVFSDEDQFEGARRCRPYFKPGWNPDLMLAQNLTCHLAVYRLSLVQQAGGLRASFDGSQDYDLALRATRAARRVRHVPDVLYHWRQSETSFSARHAQHCVQAARRALAEDLGEAARVEPAPGLPQWNQIVYALPAPPPKVCMILPPGGQPPADAAYPAIEVLHGDEDGAARLMASDVLLFLAAGLTPTAPGWVAELAGHALRPEIGCAGARIDGPDGRIRHAGFMLDPRRVAVTLQPRSDVDDPGYRGQFMLARSVSAISRACLAVRRDVFLRAGGFDAACGALADVDLCLRLSASGLRCVWTPHARLLLSALPMPAPDAACIALMRARWGAVLANDPYVNPNLVVRAGNLALADAAAAPRKRLP